MLMPEDHCVCMYGMGVWEEECAVLLDFATNWTMKTSSQVWFLIRSFIV